MTDTRTTPADRRLDESSQQLSTADIARDGTTEPPAEAAVTSAGARDASPDRPAAPEPQGRPSTADPGESAHARPSHQSDIPIPTVALFSDDAAAELRDRWTDVQAGFVDEPRSSVENADALVAEVMKRLADSFATERQALEAQWSSGDEASTEELRVALRRYRSFFDRLLSI